MDASLLARLNAALAGRYALERELGAGGMATVWLARDLKHERSVALKVLRPDLAAVLGPERFLREVRITARLNHPHILPLLDSGDADGFLYYVMPYVAGESLRDRLERERQLPLDDALQIAREVADALSYAHGHDVVHRDVKPENILLESGHAVVADFGIARAISAAGGEALTQTGIAVGTPAYMSPEQGAGSRELDGRSDLYSLGCVLYEMLAGHPPFMGTTVQETVARHFLDEVPRLAAARSGVPPHVERAVHAVLAKTPADRFSTGVDFIKALNLTKEPAGQATRSASEILNSRLILGAILLVAVLAIVAKWMGATSAQSDRGSGRLGANEPPSVAVLPFDNHGLESRDQYLGEALHQDIILHLGMIGSIRVLERGSVMRYRDGTAPTRAVVEHLGADFVLRSSLAKDSARVRFASRLLDGRTDKEVWSQVYERNLSLPSLFAIRSDIAQHLAEALQVGITAAERGRIAGRAAETSTAYQLYLRATQLPYESDAGANVAAAELLKQAVTLDSGFAEGLAALANVYFARSYTLAQSRMWADSAIGLARDAIRRDPDLPSAYRPLGRSYLDQGRLRQATEVYTKILQLRPNDGDALLLLGWIHFLRGDLDNAAQYWIDARAVDPMNGTVLLDLAALHTVLGDREKSNVLYAAVQALGQEHPYIGGNLVDASRLLHEGKAVEALAVAEGALATQPRNVVILETTAGVALRAGADERAVQLFDEMRRAAPDDWNYWGLTYRTSYAYALAKLGLRQRADELLDQTLQDAIRLVGEGDERPGIRREIAAIHAARGGHQEAYDWLARAVDAGWRLEAMHPSPLFGSIRDQPRFHEIMDRIDHEIRLDGARIERLNVSP